MPDKMKIKNLAAHLKPFSKYFLIAWAVIILTISSIPSIPTLKVHAGELSFRLDYLIHIAEYGILSCFAYSTFAEKESQTVLVRYLLITIFLVIFAYADEFHQKYIPGRSYNLYDFISNFTGIITALLCYLIKRRRKKNEPVA